MLMIISPAKALDYSQPTLGEYSQPDYISESSELIEILKDYAVQDIAKLMKLSDKLSSLNLARYATWQTKPTTENAKQALFAFQGDVYQGMDAASFNDEEIAFAQQHLRILSGLYGLLKPLDLMQPYRLEMGTKLSNQKGKDLYAFWDNKLATKINRLIEKEQLVVNLASNEYFKAAQAKQISGRIITPVFKDWKNDKYKIISFYAKKARGLMSRYIIQNRITEAEQIKNFDLAGYSFSEAMSEGDNWVFIRKQ